MKANEAAAALHRHMVTHSKHGYTQGSGRWGGSKTETIKVNGVGMVIGTGDYDCSSSVIAAYKAVLKHTKYNGKLDKATYTGNMRSVFTKSGLFKAYRYPKSGTVPVGSVYLNDACHTGMYQGGGKTSEFLINEKGGITGGKSGDQTGKESCIRSSSAYGSWQWVLVPTSKLTSIEIGPTSTASASTGTSYKVVCSALNVRNVASTIKPGTKVIGTLKKGATVKLTNVKKNTAGNTWGKVASGSLKGGYVAVKFKGSTYMSKR